MLTLEGARYPGHTTPMVKRAMNLVVKYAFHPSRPKSEGTSAQIGRCAWVDGAKAKYRDLASRSRAMARNSHAPDVRRTLLDLADDYEKLAAAADKTKQGEPEVD